MRHEKGTGGTHRSSRRYGPDRGIDAVPQLAKFLSALEKHIDGGSQGL